MVDAALDPSTPSPAHKALKDIWAMIRAILAGIGEVRAAGETYLPKYPAETTDEYSRRLAMAPWRPEFQDVVRSIASKPFAKEVSLAGDPSEDVKALAEDIDGRGNNLHVFAKTFFEEGVSQGAVGVLVDYPTTNPNATRAEQKASGARPYWVLVKAEEIISIRDERRGAMKVVTHLRLREFKTVVNGFEETVEERIRVLGPGYWQLWKPKTDAQGAITEWIIEDKGDLTLDRVPFVLFATNELVGAQYVRPPLLDLAYMQIELYQQLSQTEEIYTSAAAPMLTANGMGAPSDGSAVETGPRRILYAPGAEGINTSWAYLQPDANNLKEVRSRAADTGQDIRRLGLQPLLPQTGDVTATASGIEAAKAHTAVGTWANGCKDALEQAWVLTQMWRKQTEEVEVTIHTDFAAGIYGAEEIKALIDMRDKGMISEETFWDEMLRRGVLGPAFDKDEERDRLEEETPADDDLLNANLPPVDPNLDPNAPPADPPAA